MTGAVNQYGCTMREWQILLLIEQGQGRHEIAEELDISESSVRTYISRMCDRFSCSQAELPQAVRVNILGPE